MCEVLGVPNALTCKQGSLRLPAFPEETPAASIAIIAMIALSLKEWQLL